MYMTDSENVKKYQTSKNPKKQIEILAELNACSQETIKKILVENGVPESALPKKRGPKPKPKAPDVVIDHVKVPKVEVPVADVPEMEVVESDIITGEEVDLGINDICISHIHIHRPIESILLTGPRDEMEERRVERYNAIPEAVKDLCRAEIANLYKEILAMEKRRDSLIDFMNGEVVCQK